MATAKLVVLYIDDKEGNFNRGFPVSLTIREGNRVLGQRVKASLPSNPKLLEYYNLWQSRYINLVSSLQSSRRVTARTSINVSICEITSACKDLKFAMNDWLNSEEFMPISHQLDEDLRISDHILFICNTKLLDLQRLPWHFWEFFEHFPNAEVALSFPVRQRNLITPKDRVKVLAVFGNNQTLGTQTRINIDKDWELLQQHLSDAEFLPAMQEPTLEALHEQLWEQNPDILYYGGHSSIEDDGRTTTINIRHDEKIQINDLIQALKKPDEGGLQLAIFNSCEGLEIARQLANSYIPQVIVMREPVPDEVAQRFLQYFLKEFANGKPLYLAVRKARERMGYLERKFPGATLLPMIFQNPAELPYTWRQIRGVSTVKESNQVKQVDQESGTDNQRKQNHSTNRDKNSDNPQQQQEGSPVIVPMWIYCPKCGVQSLSTSKFCYQCGFDFTYIPQSSLLEEQKSLIRCPTCNYLNSSRYTQCGVCRTTLFERSVIEATNLNLVTQMSLESNNNQNQNQAIVPAGLGIGMRGRYEIIRKLGGGGFGETYLAQDRDLPGNPYCVVKLLKPQFDNPSTLQTAIRLFSREAQVLDRLGNKHDQIPRLLAYFEENQEFYLVQEFIDGEDLSKELTPGTQWSQDQVITFLQDVLKILEFVHQQNVIHRDIKPANLIRRASDSKIVLVDFGAVKETLMANTETITAIGTRGYMPIEQMQGHPKFNSDIYSLGIICIQAITGIHPLNLRKDHELIWRNKQVISPELAAILDKMVCNDFRKRYQSATEVLECLVNATRNTTAGITQLRSSSLLERFYRFFNF